MGWALWLTANNPESLQVSGLETRRMDMNCLQRMKLAEVPKAVLDYHEPTRRGRIHRQMGLEKMY